MNANNLSAFRLGDIRGLYPAEIDEDFAYRFGIAFSKEFGIKSAVALGRDMRGSSALLQNALAAGFIAGGVNVYDLGLCTTELGYYASASLPGVDATLIVTASHNPARYNGIKCVLRNGEAVTYATGLGAVQQRMTAALETDSQPGMISNLNLQPDYVRFLHRRFKADELDPGAIALNGLNGTAATLAVTIADQFEIPVTWFRREPGPIPEEGADPSNPALAREMKKFMASGKFSLGVAWDGDCDRCVFFDADGSLIPTYYIIGLLAEHFLKKYQGGAIVFDTKLCWNTLDIIRKWHGIPVRSETGHAFMKQKMRAHNAVYGGELSSHHFFADFFYCDSGMFAWLTMLELLSQREEDLGLLIDARRAEIACTPEISFKVTDADAAFAAVTRRFGKDALHIDDFDGPSFEMHGGFRFTLRKSKTEPLVRLNFESRDGHNLLLDRARDVLAEMARFQADDTNLAQQLVIQ